MLGKHSQPKVTLASQWQKNAVKCSSLEMQPVKRAGFCENPQNHPKGPCQRKMSFYYAMPQVNAKLSQPTGIRSLSFQMPTLTTFISRGFKRHEASLSSSKINLYQNTQRSVTCYFGFSITNSLKSLCMKFCQMLIGSDC